MEFFSLEKGSDVVIDQQKVLPPQGKDRPTEEREKERKRGELN